MKQDPNRIKYWFAIFFSILFLTGCGAAQHIDPGPQPDTRPKLYWSGRTITGAESFSSKRIYCTGNISIESGGSLSLDYVTLYMSCESDAQYGIFVNSGGTLIIIDNSIITAHSTAEGYYQFWFKSGSTGQITNSTVEGTWTPNPAGKSQFNEAGMFVEANNFSTSGSTFQNSKGNGIEAYWFNTFSATNSNFINNGANGLLIRNVDNFTVSGCNLSHNGILTTRTDGCGLIFMVGTGTITNNTINNNRFTGMEGSGAYNVAINTNQANNNGHFGIFLHDEFSSSYAEVYNNTCEANALSSTIHTGLSVENAVAVYAHDNTFNGNYIGLRLLSNSLTTTIEGNIITNNITHGVHIDNSSPTFYRNTITGNDKGVFIQDLHGTPNPNFGDTSISRSGYNNLSSNTTNGIYNNTTQNIMAENNFWGYYSKGSINGYNDDTSSRIDVIPFLTAVP
ncbi:MAG: right-handed parallel beta-helix repeat-containing protein [Candidatus Margulisbacteria bacterium]|nr:right-handed parallel beta-helix repeat-containing protein [Candidatus Margulisiibacteriota bacterium]MBU1022285.1 right-handed parallel beta-helix repeat-containing protein [Candidatus Margulisiibacteriota bacterium]MBU1729276.1 right-handed parallel beta-helix repeat-containing protein [Candidatus Margulisiibacteriota bacterium]MBU1955549.1 right-handed parallel beta-helix repeat-containing protein [Candidatus Margulisiibacteriota bacterium]